MTLFDKVKGALYGVAIGDSIGAAFEFSRSTPKIKWTGIITDETIKIPFQFKTYTLIPHSVTDDTEMTIQLLSSLIKNKLNYKEDDVIISYLNWSNLKETMLGRNTRSLMKGVTTIKGFRRRQEKIDTSSVESNGSLMRAFPLSLLPNWKEASDIDTSLTNDNEVNKECSLLYLSMLRCILYDEEMDIKCKQPSIKQALEHAMNNKIVDVSINKGWVVHALYVSIITLFNTTSYEDGINFIAKNFIKGDTDTIMAISGALLGALYGYDKMRKEENTCVNIKKIDDYFSKTDRPKFNKKLFEQLNILVKDTT